MRGRGSGGRSKAMLTHTGRRFTSSPMAASGSRRWANFKSAATGARSREAERQAAGGTMSTSVRSPRENRMYHAAYESASESVNSTPHIGQARSRFSPSSSSTGGTFRSRGTGPHSCGPTLMPFSSHASRDRALHAPTRSTRALSPSGVEPEGASSWPARASASSLESSRARTAALSSRARCGGPCASSASCRYSRPNRSQARPSVESRARRARSAKSESPDGVGGGGAWSSAASTRALQREVAMLLGRVLVPLRLERRQRIDQTRASVARVNDVVEVAARRRQVGVRELLAVFGLALLGRLFSLVEDLDRALRSHHRDLRARPGDVVVAADVLRVHHVVRAAVRLARDHRQLGHRRLAV